MGDRTEVFFHFSLVHADAVVGDRQGLFILVDRQLDLEIAAAETDRVVRQCQICQLVDGIGCVRDQLAQKNFLVGVNRIDHQIQKTLGFCLKLLFCHCFMSFQGISTLLNQVLKPIIAKIFYFARAKNNNSHFIYSSVCAKIDTR